MVFGRGATLTVELNKREAEFLWALCQVVEETPEEVLKKGVHSYLREKQAEPGWTDKVREIVRQHLAIFNIKLPEGWPKEV